MSTAHTGDTSGGGETMGTPTGGATGGSADIVIDLKPCLYHPTWPADLILDRTKYNWEEWNRRLSLFVAQQHFSNYLDGSFPCPDPAVHTEAARNWKLNDRSLRAFILLHISDDDVDIASQFMVAHDAHDALRKIHENLGIRGQVHVMKEALGVRFSLLPPLNFTRTLEDISRLHGRFCMMAKNYDDKLKIILIFNALDTFPQLQSTIDGMLASNPAITSVDVGHRILWEEQLLRREERGIPLMPRTRDNNALAAVANRATNPRPVCANCKRTNHRTEFCIARCGKMAGRKIDEARNAQRAALGKPPSRRNRAAAAQDANAAAANTAAESTGNNDTITIDGIRYTLVNITAATQASR